MRANRDGGRQLDPLDPVPGGSARAPAPCTRAAWPLRLRGWPTAGAPAATPGAGRRPPPRRGPSGGAPAVRVNPSPPGGAPRAAEPIRGRLLEDRDEVRLVHGIDDRDAEVAAGWAGADLVNVDRQVLPGGHRGHVDGVG